MCRILTTADPQRFRPVSRSVRIAGHSTSIRLENAFWIVLDDMAKREGRSTAKLISELHDEAVALYNHVPNLASTLRTICILHQGQLAGRPAGVAADTH